MHDESQAVSPTLDSPELSPLESTRFYLELYNTAVDVQKHFNDIEWKIRGLALTVATFALGAGGLAAQNSVKVGPISLAAAVLGLGLILWYAFYFVDRHWYHPLLKAAVTQGTIYEEELARYLPKAHMTALITERSAIKSNKFMRWVSGVKPDDTTMHSDHKLRWFYSVGATALTIAAIGFQIGAMLTHPLNSGCP